MDLTQRYYTETLLPIRENNEETDPIFTASPAYGISSEDITYWNNKQQKLSAVQMIGSMYRTNVSGGGGISIQGNTGQFPTVLEAGTYTVITDMQSNTLSYGITVNFGGNTYTLNTTNGHIYDSRSLTIPANSRWSGTVVGSVASNTKLSVKVENVVDEVTQIALVGMTNDYNDLNNKPILTNYFDGAVYDSNTKRINFTNNNIIKAYIDATAFIKDGMVDNVEIEDGKLIITFNTDSGKEPIELDITAIFDPSNYYDKDTVDDLLDEKANTADLADVATSGEYGDLINSPTNVSDFTNDAGYLTSSDLPTNHVTTDTVQNITGEKTLVGNKKLKFKQSSSTDELGFTAYNTANVEYGNFEVLPNDRAVNLGIYSPDTTPNRDWLVGFKYQAKDSAGGVHKFGLRVPPRFGTSTYTEYYIPTTINGLQADNTGSITIPIPTLPTLATVATTGDYNDLINAPTIPTITFRQWTTT